MSETPERAAALRIVDANLNRAREALRVLEEHARFVLNDAALSLTIKKARHRLARCVEPALMEELMRRRDVTGDVGRDIKTPTEGDRADAASVVVAAGKRLAEALRAVEEYGKIIDIGFASRLEHLRYDAYEIERRMAIMTSARERFGHLRLYVIVTESLCAGHWFDTASAALDGGADVLQLREKQLPDRELLDRARRLAVLCRDRGRCFIVNDRPDVAAIAGADGVHLGQDDLPVAAARRVLPSSAIVGVSTHTAAQFDAAVDQAPDYLAVGPMFTSQTKPSEHLAGPELVREARSRTALPIVAIGGINRHNATEVLSAGASCLCVCRSVIAANDVAAACRAMRALLDRP